MLNKRISKQETVEKCKALNKLAMEKDKNPLAVFEDGYVKHFSVFSEKIHYKAKLSRFVVSYNPKLGTLDCGCCLRKVTCTHKAMCIWYLSQYEKLANKDLPGLKENTPEFQNQTNARQSKETYPLEEENILHIMLNYLRQFKTYNKEEVHNHRVFAKQKVPQHIIPIEQICHLRKTQLSNPITVTNNAKVVTLQGVFHNFKSFVKKCFQCGHFYRYQESNHGIHNYDDRFFIGIDICIYLQQHLQHHSSIASFVNAYNTMFDEKLQHHKVMYALHLTY